MARITVEDCIDKFPSRFELVLVASLRARKLHSGDTSAIERDNDKNTVIALREISESAISPEVMKENLIQEYQTVTINDEEDENLELESLENPDKDNIEEVVLDAPNQTNEIEEEMNKLVSSEDSEIEEQYEIIDDLDNKISSSNNDESSNTHETSEGLDEEVLSTSGNDDESTNTQETAE